MTFFSIDSIKGTSKEDELSESVVARVQKFRRIGEAKQGGGDLAVNNDRPLEMLQLALAIESVRRRIGKARERLPTKQSAATLGRKSIILAAMRLE